MTYRVPVAGGPEIDLCRQCQIVWLDAGELEEMPRRTPAQLRAEQWGNELRDIARRRRDSDFYTRVMQRHPWSKRVL